MRSATTPIKDASRLGKAAQILRETWRELACVSHIRLEPPAGRSAGLRPGVGQMSHRRRVGDRRSRRYEMYGLGD